MTMKPFSDKKLPPAPDQLKKTFGKVREYYQELMTLSAAYTAKWNFSVQSGWMLKVADSKKALFYLIPHEREFQLNLTFRETELGSLLSDKRLASLKNEMLAAHKFTEGYVMRFLVTDAASAHPAIAFITRLVELRKGAAANRNGKKGSTR
jgi:hypothetical protein